MSLAGGRTSEKPSGPTREPAQRLVGALNCATAGLRSMYGVFVRVYLYFVRRNSSRPGSVYSLYY